MVSAANAACYAYRFEHAQVTLVEFQFIRRIDVYDSTTAAIQAFKLDPHIETPWLTDSPHQGASHKVGNYSWASGTFKTATTGAAFLYPLVVAFRFTLRGFLGCLSPESVSFRHSSRHIDSSLALSTTPHSLSISIKLLTSA